MLIVRLLRGKVHVLIISAIRPVLAGTDCAQEPLKTVSKMLRRIFLATQKLGECLIKKMNKDVTTMTQTTGTGSQKRHTFSEILAIPV